MDTTIDKLTPADYWYNRLEQCKEDLPLNWKKRFNDKYPQYANKQAFVKNVFFGRALDVLVIQGFEAIIQDMKTPVKNN